MGMWAPLGRNSNSSHEAANCGYARNSMEEFGNKCLPSYFSCGCTYFKPLFLQFSIMITSVHLVATLRRANYNSLAGKKSPTAPQRKSRVKVQENSTAIQHLPIFEVVF